MGSRGSLSSAETWPKQERRTPVAKPASRPRASLFVSLAHTLCDAGRTLEAEELCRWVLAENPRLVIAQTALGRALFESGQLHEAQAVLERAVSEHPGHFAAYRWLGEVLVQAGDWHRAYAVLHRAEALSGGHVRIAQLMQIVTGVTPIEPIPDEAETIPNDLHGPGSVVPWPAAVPTPWPAQPARSPSGVDPAAVVSDDDDDQPRGFRERGRRLLGALADMGRGWASRAPRRTLAALAVGAFCASVGVGLLVRPGRRPLPQAPGTAEPARVPGPSAASRRPSGLVMGTVDELLAVFEQGRTQLGRPGEEATTPLLAATLLSLEYGRPVDAAVEGWVATLAREPMQRPRQEELGAARVLLSLLRGDLAAADAQARESVRPKAATPVLRFAEAKLRQRQGDREAAITALGPAEADAPSAFWPSRLLRAELNLDQGEAGHAVAVLEAVLGQQPDHPRAFVLLLEARRALGTPLTAAELALGQRLCPDVGKRSPTVAAACLLDRAIRLRREDRRDAARDLAMRVASLLEAGGAEPRLVAGTAELLANLGVTDRARVLVERAGRHAGPAFAPLAWASFAVRLSQGHDAVPPGWPPPGPEARLVAVRAAYMEDGALGVREILRRLTPVQAKGDPDLQWFQSLARITRPAKALRFASALREQEAPGPVGAFVAGALARWGGRRHLALHWLVQALSGHGDVCRAADLYAAVLVDLGRSPAQVAADARLRRARTEHDCVLAE